MKRMIKISIAMVIVFVLFSSFYSISNGDESYMNTNIEVDPNIEYHFDLVENPESIYDLIDMSPIILEISNKNSKVDTVDVNGVNFIYSNIKIETVLKDQTKNLKKTDSIPLLEYGFDDKSKDKFLLPQNKTHIVFLKKIKDPKFGYAYRTVGLYYGKFTKDDSKSIDGGNFINDMIMIDKKNISINKNRLNKIINSKSK